tara:strand:+ start:1129 stop:1299 length:171 start_codon:yes stop_codon:yes gene_type:complete
MARDRIARILLDATRSGTKTRRARALEKTRIEKNRPTDRPTVSWNQSWLTPREVTR